MLLTRYARWLHTGVPAGTVEALPLLGPGGTTSVPGVRVAGDLTGVPLLKFALESGTAAVEAIAEELAAEDRDGGDGEAPGPLDLVIVGAGVAGLAAAVEAQRRGLQFRVLEAATPLSTLRAFPRGKPIYTYPKDMTPRGEVQVSGEHKEALIEELQRQMDEAGIEPVQARVDRVRREGALLVVEHGDDRTQARRVLIAVGRGGEQRRLGVAGEDLPHVTHRLFDPADHAGQEVVVVGGGDSAAEAAIALCDAGATVTLVHRGDALSRPKPDNAEAVAELAGAGKLTLQLNSTVEQISDGELRLHTDEGERSLAADAVLVLIGRQAPLGLLRRIGIALRGELTPARWAGFGTFFTLCLLVYLWKSGGPLTAYFRSHGLFPFGVPSALGLGAQTALGKTLRVTLEEPGFYYTLLYTAAILGFGVARIRRRQTPYVTRQTLTLMAIQVVPLMLLPYLVLPWMGHAGMFDGGALGGVADALMPEVSYGHGREYWRAFGLILAWPLFIWNALSEQPMWAWLGISFVQTFVLIPLIVARWGKGAYCGWICSCGALAETMGDRHRERMPHGPGWNRANMLGQVILLLALLLFVLRVATWVSPGASLFGLSLGKAYRHLLSDGVGGLGLQLDYYHAVDLLFAGAIGVGCYFWFSGRVWCRFGCPLAALMHIYQRLFGRFAIFADKKRCISCNQCTATCHQGIDVMAYASRGAPMEDPQCVRCSACVQVCPTGVLSFGRRGADGAPVLDRLPATRSGGPGRRRLPVV